MPQATTTDTWLTAPTECGPAAGFGVYLHVPFCAHRCGYCDFATSDRHGDWMPRYARALRDDLARAVDAGPRAGAPPGAAVPATWPEVTSVFVGGGTPTLLEADDLAGLVVRVREVLDLAPDAEVTVECNPETVRPGLFETLADAGVNRVSLGVQSFAGHVLEVLERQHSVDAAAGAVRAARAAGIDNVSLDLIYGVPGESADDWASTLGRALALVPDHVSAYALTVHGNTRLGRQVAGGEVPAPRDDVQHERWEATRALLGDAGFDHYELSNWARTPAHRSCHNVLYWRHGDYLGVGVGAHGHLAGRRWWSTRSIERYVAAVEDARAPTAGDESLTVDERAEERLLLALRLREGLHPRDAPPVEPLTLEDAVAAGLLETSCGRLQCTGRGWFLLDEVVTRLTA